MHNQFKIYLSESFDPKFNLSVEEWLMKHSQPNDVVMFLWQNANTIVIGRNQNPYKECSIKKIKDDGVQLVRRLSGGGAVFHDKGNLNFTFIAADANYNVENNMNVILNGLSMFGIHGCFNGRNDLVIQQRKFSGNAFFSESGMNCHHGTLLVNVDFHKMSKYLNVSPLKLQSKGIDSVASRVVNLKDISKEITIKSLKDALTKSFNDFYKTNAEVININEKTIDVTDYIKKYSSWEWNYSESPDFNVTLEEKFSWGLIEIYAVVSDGIIKNCKIYTDSIKLEDFHKLEKALENEMFKSENMTKVIKSSIKDNQIMMDLCKLINDKLNN